MTVVRRGPLDALRQRLRPGSQRAAASATKTKGKPAVSQTPSTDAPDTFERDGTDRGGTDRGGTNGGGREAATFSTKRAVYSASQVFCGAEFAFKVNHVDPSTMAARK